MVNRHGFGEFVKNRRITLKLTLREFCLKHKLDPGNISKLERGILPPPKSQGKLKEYAKYLRLKEGTDDWHQFFDLAAAESGKLPKELMEDEIIDRLPLLFRTLRGKKISKDKLDELIRKIKES